ncbi:unnamed protein product [Bathycoccus prasinos]
MLSPATSIACGLIYGYLAYQSFLEPEILEAFSSGAQQSLSSLTKGFSYETTVAVGWAHFIAMDLLAGRYIYFDGLKNDFITRHSLVLTLFFGPLGVVSHVLTRGIVGLTRSGESGRYLRERIEERVRNILLNAAAVSARKPCCPCVY